MGKKIGLIALGSAWVIVGAQVMLIGAVTISKQVRK